MKLKILLATFTLGVGLYFFLMKPGFYFDSCECKTRYFNFKPQNTCKNTCAKNTLEDKASMDTKPIPTPSTSKIPPVDTSSNQRTFNTTNMTNLKSSNSVPEKFSLNGNTFTLFRYKEPKLRRYCNSEIEDCSLKPIFGDYTDKGFYCYGNPFYNQMNPDLGNEFYYGEDANGDGVPSVEDTAKPVKINDFELLPAYTYDLFLLKDRNNRCHPYKYEDGYATKKTVTTNGFVETAYLFKTKNVGLKDKSYIGYNYLCGGSKSRNVEYKSEAKALLKQVEKLAGGENVYSLSTKTSLENLLSSKLSFISHVTLEKLQNGGYAILESKQGSEKDIQKEFLNKIIQENIVIFVENPIFPEVLFYFVKPEYMFYPGC